MPQQNAHPSDRSLQVSHWLTKLIGAIGFIAFGFFAFITFAPSKILTTLVLLLFALWGVYLFIAYGSTKMDAQKITHTSWLGKFEIQWDEVEAIKADSLGNNIVFAGKNKQLVIPGFSMWSGRDKGEMISLYRSALESRALQVHDIMLAAFAISKNTKKA